MKISKVSCEQFAGIKNFNVELKDGVNVIYGKNESGKSTLVNLISRTIFQDYSQKGKNGFKKAYFPSTKRSGKIKGDFIDGKVVFETPEGNYTLSKVWDKQCDSKLVTPSGAIKDKEKIEEILNGILIYGEGIYNDMLLTPQNNMNIALQTLLDSKKSTDSKQELTSVVTKAFAQGDGISIDLVEQKIEGIIKALLGKHWDIEKSEPEYRATPWKNDTGAVMEAYYSVEDVNIAIDDIARLEKNIDKTASDYKQKIVENDKAKKALEDFKNVAELLKTRASNEKSLYNANRNLEKYSKVLANWPLIVENLKKAEALKVQADNRKIYDEYTKAKAIHDTIVSYNDKKDKMLCPKKTEITNASKAIKAIDKLENKLCGMNLTAAAEMLGNNTIEIRSLRTGELLEIKDKMAITEAVHITIPNVMEMELTPTDVDANEINASIAEKQAIVDEIFKKYNVEAVEALEKLLEEYNELQLAITAENNNLSRILGSDTFEAIEAAAKKLEGNPREKNEIEADISALCGANNISDYIVAANTTLNSYKDEHLSIEALNKNIVDINKEIADLKASLKKMDAIPQEYESISDTEQYLKILEKKVYNTSEAHNVALAEKARAEQELESYRDKLTYEPQEELENRKQIFNEQNTLLKHWLHIREVFLKEKENMKDNPMEDIANKFSEYLQIISSNRVSSEFPEADKLDMKIYSNDNLLDYDKLSEGTKETVSLAFRLAVLEHLFPNGGGIAVLDDSFANMDEERTEQSVALVKKFAEKHQVIFLTCQQKYADMLQGNCINL